MPVLPVLSIIDAHLPQRNLAALGGDWYNQCNCACGRIDPVTRPVTLLYEILGSLKDELARSMKTTEVLDAGEKVRLYEDPSHEC
jgi:hypothetical protein